MKTTKALWQKREQSSHSMHDAAAQPRRHRQADKNAGQTKTGALFLWVIFMPGACLCMDVQPAALCLRCSAPVSRRTCAALHQFRSAPALLCARFAPHLRRTFYMRRALRSACITASSPAAPKSQAGFCALCTAFCTPAKRAFARFAEGLDGSPRPARAKAPRGMRSARTPQAPRAFLELSGELCP